MAVGPLTLIPILLDPLTSYLPAKKNAVTKVGGVLQTFDEGR